jgi:hypothetical protein
MSKALGATLVRTGKASLELTADDLFDRIINLKFIRKRGRSFTLRSDYEPVFHDDNTISFKTCAQKPDIKITYKQVAESVAIEVDIEIVNFFTGDGDKENVESMNTADGDPVQWCIIQMGYRRQFPDWTKTEKTTDLARFWDLNNNNITTEAEVRRGRQILVQILTGYPKTYPPDKVTYFKGIIGTLEGGLRWNHTEDELVKGYGDPEFPKDYSEIEEVLFQFVTRRFIRSSVQHIAETVQDFTNYEALSDIIDKKFEQKVMIYGFNDYDDAGANAVSRLRASVMTASKVPTDTTWTDLPLLDNGVMSIENANKFGVICVVSKTLRSMPANSLYGYGLSAEQAAVLRPIPPSPFDGMQNTLGGQLVGIQQHYPFLRWYELTDGSFYFYHEKDTDEDLWSDPFIKEMQKENIIFLPAIYDMTPSGTRTIRCPFISFIGPMTTVLFQSRFTIGTLVSYFYPPKTNAFLVITAAIAFATVADENTMELMCVDLPPKEVIVDEDSGEVIVSEPKDTGETPEVARLQQERNMQWIEQQLNVVLHKTGAMDTDSRWENIVKNDVLADIRPDRWPEGQEFTEGLALTALKEWNSEKWDEWMNRGNSIENAGLIAEGQENPQAAGIGGRTGIKVPWLKEGIDTVIVRHPFQAEYPDDEKVVV